MNAQDKDTPVPASIHPGLTNEKLIAILTVAAAEVVGKPVTVVRFRSSGSMHWHWSVEGRAALHASHKL